MIGIVFWISAFMIVYVYVGYPLLITLFAQLRGRTIQGQPILPTVTLLFAAHNEEKVIAQKLDNSLALNYPRDRLQILVADDGSTDQTPEIAKAYQTQGVQLIHFADRRGKLSAINSAIKFAANEIILFSDSDNFYPVDTVHEIVKYFSDSSVGAVSGGRNVVGDNSLGSAEGLYWKYEEHIKLQESRLHSCVGVAGDLLAIRRELYISPPPNIINDDFFTALSIIKQGYRVIYAPKARSYHPAASSEMGEMERRARMVAGRYQAMFLAWQMLPFQRPVVLWQVISHKYLRPLVPFAMILMLFTNILAFFNQSPSNMPAWLALSPPYGLLFFTLQLVFYSLALMGKGNKRKGLMGKILYLPTFLLNSNLAALFGLYRYMSNRQTVIWKKVREDV
jgi:cellulose synthase/poly-beta-1,6-N-acetylglucosamine synthase-like glycosyltransferase